MNIQPMEAKTYTSAAEIIRDAQERRRRLFAPRAAQHAPAVKIEPIASIRAPEAPKVFQCQHDAHVVSYREWLTQRAWRPPSHG